MSIGYNKNPISKQYQSYSPISMQHQYAVPKHSAQKPALLVKHSQPRVTQKQAMFHLKQRCACKERKGDVKARPTIRPI